MSTPYTPGLVSIILPVYNVAPYLSRAVDSVLHQTCPHWELLMVDDGSTDDSGLLCAEYAKQDARIHTHRIVHGGVSRARNFGLSMARGEWVFFLDSDDFLPEASLETLLAHASEADVVMGSYPEKPQTSRSVSCPRRFALNNLSHEDKCELYFLRLYHTVWNKLYRRERLTCGFQEGLTYGEDTAFNFDQLPGWRTAVVIPDDTYHYAARKDSITRQFRVDRMQQVQQTFDLFDRHFSDCAAVMDAVSCWYVAEMLRYFHMCACSPDMPPALGQLILEAWLSDAAFKPERIHAGALSGAASALWACVLQMDVPGILRLLNSPLSTPDRKEASI